MKKDPKYDYSSVEEDTKLSALAHGPMTERGCTDIFCCIVFVVFLVGMVFVTFDAYKNGDPARLAYPYDPDRNSLQSFS